jgi:hypothetical protein
MNANNSNGFLVLLTYAKWKDADADWLNDGATQMKEFDAKRKEFKVSQNKLIKQLYNFKRFDF